MAKGRKAGALAVFRKPGPEFSGTVAAGITDFHYYDWVDQFDTLGLAKNVPVATGKGPIRCGRW